MFSPLRFSGYAKDLEQAILGLSKEMPTHGWPIRSRNTEQSKPMSETTPIPANELPAAPESRAISGGYKPGALKSLLQSVRARTDAVMADAVSEVQQLHKALDHVEGITKDAKETKDSIRAEIGQFSNMGPE